MKIIATNLGKPTKIIWENKERITGIYKFPTATPLYLDTMGVANDTIGNTKVHGGTDKACYLFGEEEYTYWKGIYPNLDWQWGMFGENLTVSGLNEAEMRIGNIYRIGEAVVQVSQPREPCFMLGVRFKNQDIVAEFMKRGYPGTYVRVLEKGYVAAEDSITLLQESENSLTVKQFYELLFSRTKDLKIVRLAIENDALPHYKRERLQKLLKRKEA